VGPVIIAVVRPATHARPEQNDDQDDECAVEQVFPVIVHRPDALMPLLPRKNVQQEPAERDDGDHQDCGGQNNGAVGIDPNQRTCPPLELQLHKFTASVGSKSEVTSETETGNRLRTCAVSARMANFRT
jgi:hypothetical protein